MSLEIDLAASLLYPAHALPFSAGARCRRRAGRAAHRGDRFAGHAIHRGRHDELPRAFAAANGLHFDILMDIGGFRDMHRHRRCTQLLQGYTTQHGYELPDFPGQPQLSGSPVQARYEELMQRAFNLHAKLAGTLPSTTDAASTSPKIGAHSNAAVPVPQFGEDGIRMQWGQPLSTGAPRAELHL